MASQTKEVVGAERIARFVEASWKESYGTNNVYMRYYILPIEPGDQFTIPGFSGDVVEFGRTAFKLVVAHIADKSYSTRYPWIVSKTAAGQTVAVENLNRTMPTAVYIVVTTPLVGHQPLPEAYLAASGAVDELVGLLRAFGGNSLFRQQLYDCVVELDADGSERIHSRIVPIMQPFEGPFATTETWQPFDEIKVALKTCDENLRNRVLRVTQLIEHGAIAEPNLKYFSYWVALEVAADTHSAGKIITLLRDAYKAQDNASIQNALGLTALKDMRTAIFHEGMPYLMSTDVERYFQQLLLDVIRAKLGLPCKHYLQHIIDQGFDLKSLDVKVGTVLNFEM